MKKKKLTVTLTYIEEYDDEYLEDYKIDDIKTFDEARDDDYDNIDRPLSRLEDCGWTITRKKIEDIN